MAYLIDGHNLIGKMKNIRLEHMDDEAALIRQLQVFCRVRRRSVEVYFDGAPPGFARTQRHGQVTAHYVQERLQADDAIIRRLHSLGARARNWSVVTSDRRIQAEARARRAAVVSAEAFAGQLAEAQRLAYDLPASDAHGVPPTEEIDYWLDVFREPKGKKRKPGNS